MRTPLRRVTVFLRYFGASLGVGLLDMLVSVLPRVDAVVDVDRSVAARIRSGVSP